MTSIKVAIKLRPLILRELKENLTIQWKVNGNTIYSLDAESRKKNENAFQFDHIFDMETTNYEVFDTVVKPIIESAVKGFNGTIFAYGQTSSGKTFTMMGNECHLGILPLTIDKIFNEITNTSGREFLLRVAYVEIYNEVVNDLLDNSNLNLKVREENGEVVIKCKEEVITSRENILSLMKKGDKNRRIGKTDMNEYSSRSHTIFRFTIESKDTSSNSDGAVQVSQLNLVDLAGSERASATGATGERFKEGRHINLSLSALGKVIMQLSENQEYVSFRDSKLTRILQASLGGNAMTAIICAVTPAVIDETANTLNFASRAKSIKNKPKLNEVMSDAALLKRYKKQIDILSQKLQNLDDKTSSDEVKEMANELEEAKKKNEALQERISMLQRSILTSDTKNHATENRENTKRKAKRRQTWAAPRINSPLQTIVESNCERVYDVVEIEDSGIPLSDFEIQLYTSQQNIILDDDDSPVSHNTCTISDGASYYDHNIDTLRNSPGTPKAVLREKLSYTIGELESLREHTTLEKQLRAEDEENDLRKEFAELKFKFQQMRRQNGLLEETIIEKETQMQKMEEKNKELENKLAESKALKPKPKRSIPLMSPNVGKSIYEGENVELKKKLKLAEKELSALKTTVAETENQLEKCIKEKDNLQALLKSSEEQMLELRGKVSKCEEKMAEMEVNKQELIEKGNQDKEKFNDFQRKIETLQMENDVLIEKMNQLGKMRREKEDLMVRNKELEEEVLEMEKLRDNNKDLQEQLHTLLNNDNKSEIDDLQKINCELKLEKDLLNENLKKVSEEREQLQSHVKSLEGEVNDYRGKNVCFEKDVQNLKEMNALLKQQIVDFETKIREIEQKASILEESEKSLSQQVTFLEQQYFEVQKELESKQKLERECDELKEKIERLENAGITLVEETVSQQCELHNAEKVELQNKVSKLEKELENQLTLFSNLTLDYEKNQSYLQDVENKLQILQSEKETLISQLEENRQSLDSESNLMNEIMRLTEVQITLQKELTKERQKIEELKLQFEEQQNLDRVKLADLAELLKVKENQFRELEKNFEEQVKLNEKQYNEKLSILEDSEKLQELLNNERLEFTALKEKFEEQESFINELKRKLDECEHEKESSDCKVKTLSGQIEEYQDERTQLQKKIEVSENQIQEYECKCKKLEEEIAGVSNLKELLNEEKMRFENLKVKFEEQQCHVVNLEEKVAKFQKELIENSEGLKEIKLKNIPAENAANSSVILTSDLVNASNIMIGNETVRDMSSPLVSKVNEQFQKSSPNTMDSSSIFNNDSYIDKMEFSQDETFSDADSVMDKSILVNENRKLKLQLQAKIQERRDIENAVQDMKKDISKLQQTIFDINSENTRFKEMETKLQAKNDELLIEITDITAEKNKLETKCLTLNTKVDTMQAEIECQVQKQLADYQRKLEEKEADFIEIQKNLTEISEALRLENDDLSKQLQLQTEETDKLKQTIAELTENADRIATLCQENEELKNHVLELKKQIRELTNENETLSMDLMETVEDLQKSQNSVEQLLVKIKTLEDQVTQLSAQNEKLANIKPCSCCKSKDEIQDRRSLKKEIKHLNQQLKVLQMQYEQQVTDTESLRMKSKETLDESLLNDSLNVSFIQEKVNFADEEFNSLKDVHKLLSISFQEKCAEIEKLQNIIATSMSDGVHSTQVEMKDKINKLSKDLHDLRHDLKKMSSNHKSIKSVLDKFVEDKASYKQQVEQLKDENVALQEKVTEAEIKSTTMSKEFLTVETELRNEKAELESVIDKLKSDNANFSDVISSLQKSVEQMKKVEAALNNELGTLKEEKEQLVARQNYTEVTLQEYKDNIEVCESRLKESTKNLNDQINENNKLRNQLTKLESENQKSNLESDIVLAKKELDETRGCILKEIRSLDPNMDISVKQSVSELFFKFLEALMKKEVEVIEGFQMQISLSKKQLQDERKKRTEMENKSQQLTQSLESENARLQEELILLEKKSKELVTNIEKLEDSMKALRIEKRNLNDVIKDLETESQANQIELQRYRKLDSNLNAVQEKERQSQELLLRKEAELVKKLTLERDDCLQKVETLNNKMEALKLKNKELIKNLESYENIEKQLKSNIEINNNENAKLNHEIANLKTKLEEVSTAYSNLNSEVVEKDNRIQSITLLLKNKCDKYSEYKTKLETLVPEFDSMQNQIAGFKSNTEKYKIEIGTLQEKLEQAKSDSLELRKQLEDQINENVTRENECKLLKEKNNNLEAENVKLTRKVRNSTSNVKFAEAIDDLKDKNSMLETNLEGVSNKLIEVQKQNSEYLDELNKLKLKIKAYEERLAGNNQNMSLDNGLSKSNEMKSLDEEIQQLKAKNKELDQENEELATMINSLQDENTLLALKVQEFEMATEVDDSPENLKIRLFQSESIATDRQSLIEKLQKDLQVAEMQILTLTKNVENLRKEKQEQLMKITNLEDKLETCSTRSNSPAFEIGLRRQRRSNQFNQNRNLESVCECFKTCVDESICECASLRQTVHSLESDMADKNRLIVSLELQLKNQVRLSNETDKSYQKLCSLKQQITTYQKKISELQSQLQKFEKAIESQSDNNCEVCAKRSSSKVDRSTQFPERTLMSIRRDSGIVEEYYKIQKLEKDKLSLRKYCESVKRKLADSVAKLKKYEEKYGTLSEET